MTSPTFICDLCLCQIPSERNLDTKVVHLNGVALQSRIDSDFRPKIHYSTKVEDACNTQNHLCNACLQALFRLFSDPINHAGLDLEPISTPPHVTDQSLEKHGSVST